MLCESLTIAYIIELPSAAKARSSNKLYQTRLATPTMSRPSSLVYPPTDMTILLFKSTSEVSLFVLWWSSIGIPIPCGEMRRSERMEQCSDIVAHVEQLQYADQTLSQTQQCIKRSMSTKPIVPYCKKRNQPLMTCIFIVRMYHS